MKRAFIFGLICCAGCIMLAFNATGAGGPKPEPPPKATTIAELVERYDSSRCADCHEEIYYEWEESLHARSMLGTPRTAPTIITTIEKGLKRFPYSGVESDDDITVEHLMMCAKCHLPQLDEATDDVAREIVATIRGWQQAYRDGDDEKAEELEETIASLNIGCMVCHNKVALIHKYADGWPQPDTVYGGLEGDHDDDEYVLMAEAPAIGESIFCGQCHGQGPSFELDHPSQCATAYGSYLFSYVAHGGSESCQECHMYQSELGHNMAAYRNETMIDMSLDVKVHSQSLFWRKNKEEGVIPIGIIDISMYNKTGHAIPDGWPTPNRLVLDVTAETMDGDEVFNEQRIYMPYPGRMGRGREMGRGPYEKSGILHETSLPPLQTKHETFEIPYPYEDQEKDGELRRELLNDELNVIVTLYYVPFGEFDGNEVIFFEDERTIDLKTEWVWR